LDIEDRWRKLHCSFLSAVGIKGCIWSCVISIVDELIIGRCNDWFDIGRPRFLNAGAKRWAEKVEIWFTCACVISIKGGRSDVIVDLEVRWVPTKTIIRWKLWSDGSNYE
jgi:hypothetical protein